MSEDKRHAAHFDLDEIDRQMQRLDAWRAAEERWAWGDPGPLADFVRQWGAETPEEREGIARMLTTRPDPRAKTRPSSERMLKDLDHYLKWRRKSIEETIPHFRSWIGRLVGKLRSRGWSEERIGSELARTRRGGRRLDRLLNPKAPTLADVFDLVAKRHGVTPEAVHQAYKRRKRGEREAQ